MSTASDPPGGHSLGRHALAVPPGLELIGELGRGAQSTVYRVRREGCEYALKVLDRTAPGPVGLAGFRREAALMAWVGHPGLPTVHAVGVAGGQPYLVMELIEGMDLAARVTAGPLPVGEVLEVGRQVGAALSALHAAGIVHRDLKPANIVVESGGRVRLIDLGLVMRTADIAGWEATEAVVGTLAYAAPEQSGMLRRPVDARSDLYALGAVLFECATGVPLYSAADIGELLRLHASAPVPDPRTHRPDLPAGLAAILIRLLAKDPDDRYPAAASVVADLATLADDLSFTGPLGCRDAGESRPAPLPLVGRQQQYETLADAWQRAGGGTGRVALVRGTAGTGKTRLAEELVEQVRQEGHPALAGGCVEGAGPLAVLRAAVEGYAASVSQLPDERRADAQRQLRRAADSSAAVLARLSSALAGLLGVTPAAAVDHEELIDAIVDFLVDVAAEGSGALLWVDDVEQADEATQAVLRRLTLRLPDSRLLVLLGGASDEAAPVAVDVRVEVGPLDASAASALVRAASRGIGVSEALEERLASRGAWTPLEIREYLTAIVDAGLLTPWWGTWHLDVEGLDNLALPDDVMTLISARLDRLPATAREMLTTAALVGLRFPPGLVAAATGGSADDAAAVFAAGQVVGVLEHRGGDLAFTHEHLRALLLDGLDEPERRRRHQRIAEVMSAPSAGSADALPEDPAALYVLARHHAEGEPERDPERCLAVLVAAGRLALADAAPAEAVAFLEPAVELVDRYAEHDACAIRELLGSALHGASRYAAALEVYGEALVRAHEAETRASVLAHIGDVHLTMMAIPPQETAVIRGLAELGTRLPANPVLLVLTSLGRFLAGLFVVLTRIGFGTARGDRKRAHLLRACLYRGLADGAISSAKPLNNIAATLRMLYPAARLGYSADYADALCHLNCLIGMVALPRYRGLIVRAGDVADRLGDPRQRAHVNWMGLVLTSLTGRADDIPALQRLAESERRLSLRDYMVATFIPCADLICRGHARQARALYETASARLAAANQTDHGFTLLGPVTDALRGRLVDADLVFQRIRAEPALGTGMLRVVRLVATLQIAVEHREFGAGFDDAADEFARLGLKPSFMLYNDRAIYQALAYGRIEQCRSAPEDRRPAALRAAELAVGQLRVAATSSSLAAHHVVAAAYLHDLRGDHERALSALDRADQSLRVADTPLASYEAARLRARALLALGHRSQALAAATAALTLAGTHGWPHRVAWLRAEFVDLAGSAATTSGATTSRGNRGAYHPYLRRLEALEQISRAASRILDPIALTRSALDEAIKLFGADRAYLFVALETTDPQRPTRLVPHLGRDSTGADLRILTGYGSSLVETVRVSHEPVVVTGTDEGAALGSRSAVLHGLRSIMVAPMLLDGRLLGVAYLDSQLARGMFTADDVGTLTAILNHVATALETARAAQLAVAVHAAEQRRDTAETLRHALTHLTSTLDPTEVLRRLCASLITTLPAEECRVVIRAGDKLESWNPTDPSADVEVVSTGLATIDRLLHAEGPVIGAGQDAPPATFTLDSPRSWLAIPLRARHETIGLILLACSHPDAYRTAEVDLANALAGQGMVAYDNARLFTQVQRLATVDELTGVPNRRQFFTLGHREVVLARRRGTGLAVAMIDIDHFKKINDTHGHQIGDQVIHTVARRLAETVRISDILGRYGGEEFALVLIDANGAQQARHAAERLRAAVNDPPITTDAGPLPVTASIGVTYLAPGTSPEPDLDGLLARADEALYRAKSGGRNRVELDPSDELSGCPAGSSG